jgi:hypothetical protein
VTDHVSIKQIALLMGRDPAAVFRSAAQGAFGLSLDNKRKRYSLAAVEKFYGKTATPAQQQKVTSRPDGRRGDTDRVLHLVDLARRLRDYTWRDCLIAQGFKGFRGPGDIHYD